MLNINRKMGYEHALNSNRKMRYAQTQSLVAHFHIIRRPKCLFMLNINFEFFSVNVAEGRVISSSRSEKYEVQVQDLAT